MTTELGVSDEKVDMVNDRVTIEKVLFLLVINEKEPRICKILKEIIDLVIVWKLHPYLLLLIY